MKKQENQLYIKRKLLKPWYFLIVAAIFAVICVLALRGNYSHMVTLRNDVYAADKNNGDVEGTLKNLQAYVTTHMNTDLSSGPNSPYPPIQLEYTYERLQKAAFVKLGYTNYYTEAQQYCENKYPEDFYAVVSCVQSYIETHNINIKVSATVPPAALYEFDFATPAWTPDLAGLSMLTAITFLVLAIVLWLAHKISTRTRSRE